jgi:hypothetical protein
MNKIKDLLFLRFIQLCAAWTVVALTFQITMLTISVVNPELETKISNEIAWKIDGRFNK